jgi:hypothetical protein
VEFLGSHCLVGSEERNRHEGSWSHAWTCIHVSSIHGNIKADESRTMVVNVDERIHAIVELTYVDRAQTVIVEVSLCSAACTTTTWLGIV